MKPIKPYITLLLTLTLLALAQSVLADNTWKVEANNNEFTITRSGNTSIRETVIYRTVAFTAVPGKNFTNLYGEMVFYSGDTSKKVTVNETNLDDVPVLYKNQTTKYRHYRFEVLDKGGFLLATCNRALYLGEDCCLIAGNVKNSELSSNTWPTEAGYYSYNSSGFYDAAYDPSTNNKHVISNGYVKVDDEYYYDDRTLCNISTDGLFAFTGGSRDYHEAVGHNMYATVCFTMKESDEGYQYIQILTDNRTTWDGAKGTTLDPNGEVNTPVNSIYKACFELSYTGDVVTSPYRQCFPQKASDIRFSYSHEHLYEQKYRSSSYHSSETGALVLSPQVQEINVRFDCSGKNDDTWYFKDLFVRLALEDLTDPTVLTNQITLDTGPHAYGNEFIITVPFSEAVMYETVGVYYILNTSWGNAWLETTTNYSNVLTFRGTINAPVGTVLTINGFSINSQYGDFYVTDLSDRVFSGNISKTFGNAAVADSYAYSINYVLNGGTLSGNYPTSYSYTSGIVTLPIPTNGNYGFAGWYDNAQFTGASIATIPSGSKGARTFYAKWVDDFEPYASGTVDDPYIIDNTMRLDLLATRVNAGNSYSGKYFKLEADITYTHGTGDAEHNYTAIGIAQKNFSGHFDGNGHTIKGIRIYKTKETDNFYGVFGILGKGGSIRNLILDDSKISGNSYIGGIVGLNYGTIENCAVTNSVHIRTLKWGCYYHGGISGYNQGTISGCSSAAQFDIKSEANNGNYDYGGIVGFNYDDAIVQNCVAWGAKIPANGGITHYGAICGANDAANGVLVNNVYSSTCDINGNNNNVGCDGIDTNGARRARDIKAGTGVTVTPADAATEYNVSNITAYGTGSLYYRGYIRSANTQTVHLTLGHNRPGYTFGEYSVDNGTLSGDDTEGYTLTVADRNATISATWTVEDELAITAHEATVSGQTLFWTTFFHGTLRYTLPEGATAYTMDAENHLYRLGDDGKTIPKSVAVVIIAHTGNLTLSRSDDETTITDHAPNGGNILHGSDTAVKLNTDHKVPVPGSNPTVYGTPYVLSVDDNGVLGFRAFTGTAIPANKAYYVLH